MRDWERDLIVFLTAMLAEPLGNTRLEISIRKNVPMERSAPSLLSTEEKAKDPSACGEECGET